MRREDSFLCGFLVPDPGFGPVPLWWWDAECVTPERIRWQMEKLRQGGIRNLCVINLAPAGPNAESAGSCPAFYSEGWWECWESAVRMAERLEMRLWYYDQIGFSGANFPAHIALKHPEWRGYHLTRWRAADPAPAPIWFQEGEWAYGVIRRGFDWLNPGAAAALLDRIHGEMERRMGPWLGRIIVGSFQDELPPLPTWSNHLLQLYAARYGEDLTPHVPQLFERAPGNPGRSIVRRRVYGILSELAEAAFFRPLSAWHERHHMLLGCDQAGPGREVDPYGAQRLYLDYPRTHRWFLAPGNDPDGEIKPHASLAHQWHRPRVWLEAFHSSGWGGTVEDTLHWLLPWYQAGATLYNPHAVYFSTVGGWWEWAAPDTGWRQPYFEHYPVFADGIARLSKVLSSGHHVADIAVYYPGRPLWESMAWPNGPALPHPMTEARETPDTRVAAIQDQYWALVGRQNRHRPTPGALRQGGWDFDTVDDEALRQARATADRQSFVIGDDTYRVLIFPGTEGLDADNHARIQQWIDQGGVAIGVGVSPTERTLHGVQELESTAELNAALARVLPRRVAGPGPVLIRKNAQATLFFVLPPQDTLAPMHATVDPAVLPPTEATYWFGTSGVPELWDPWRGTRTPLAFTHEANGLRVTVPFTDWPAALIVVRSASVPWDAEGLGPEPQRRPYAAATSPLGGRRTAVPEDGWIIRVEPTLDNRYQDFDRHGPDAWAGVEIRQVEVAQDPDDRGIAEGWYRPDNDRPGVWTERLWSEVACWTMADPESPADWSRPIVHSPVFGDMSYRTWAGRMARIPRSFLSLGPAAVGDRRAARSFVWVPESGIYWIQVEGNGVKSVRIDGAPVIEAAKTYAAACARPLTSGWRQVELDVQAVAEGPLRAGIAIGTHQPPRYPEWVQGDGTRWQFTAHLTLPETFRTAEAHLVALDGVATLAINGRTVLEVGEDMPYSRGGQHAADATVWLTPGDNEVTLYGVGATASVRAMVDGTWTDVTGQAHAWELSPWRNEAGASARPVAEPTEAHWLVSRPHLLPDIGWLQPDAVPSGLLNWAADPTQAGTPVWVRCTLPVGTRTVRMAINGTAQAWVDGEPEPVSQGSITRTPSPAGQRLVLRVVPAELVSEAAVLQTPIRVETSPAPGRLGDWRDVFELHTFSGVVEYERQVEGAGQRAILSLGDVRGTAEVWVDGWNAGVRLWHPYQFDVSTAWGPGLHRLRIRVTNTLGAWYAEGKPTALCPVDQQRSGLFGPVAIYED